MSGIYHEWNGTILTITSDSGTSSADLKGATGDTGIRGPQGPMGNSQTIDLENYYTKEQVDTAIENVEVDLTGYATETYVNDTITTLKDSGEINGKDGVGIVNIYDSYISSNPDDTTHMLTILTSDGKQYAIEFNDGENGVDGVNGSGVKLWDNRTGATDEGYYHNSTVKGGVITGDILLTTNGDLYYVDEAGPIFFKPSYQYNIFADGDFTVKDSAKLGGKAPEYYKHPRNLLDNSYFVNPINQRGQTSYNISQGAYCIDRWMPLNSAGVKNTVELTDNGIIFGNENNETVFLTQRFEKGYLDGTKTYTIVACFADGTISFGGYIDFGNAGFDVANITFPANTKIKWVAVYEGEYTADSLPEYQYKGYAVELAECRRYFRKKNGTLLPGFVNGNTKQIVVNVENDEPFYKFPTLEINTITWIRGSGKNITTIPTWTISAFNNSPINPVFIINFAETIDNSVYVNVYTYCSYTLSADL